MVLEMRFPGSLDDETVVGLGVATFLVDKYIEVAGEFPLIDSLAGIPLSVFDFLTNLAIVAIVADRIWIIIDTRSGPGLCHTFERQLSA